MTTYIIAEDIVDEINRNDLLSATLDETGETVKIEIEYLGKCGNDLVADCIERIYKSEWLKWVDSDEAASVATYTLTADIFEPCEGGIAVFDTYDDRAVWMGQV